MSLCDRKERIVITKLNMASLTNSLKFLHARNLDRLWLSQVYKKILNYSIELHTMPYWVTQLARVLFI